MSTYFRHLQGWKELEYYSEFAKYYSDHRFYQKAVAHTLKLQNLPVLESATFIGNGAGANSLNSYRKVKFENSLYAFEKVFKSGSDDYLKFKFYHDHVLE